MLDEIQKTYANIKNKQVIWTGNTIKVPVEDASITYKTQFFSSKYAQLILGADDRFNAAQFHFHSASEHTINNKRFDFEMHVVHMANTIKNGIIASAIGIIFDVNDYDKSVT